jgi:hypothetical protein
MSELKCEECGAVFRGSIIQIAEASLDEHRKMHFQSYGDDMTKRDGLIACLEAHDITPNDAMIDQLSIFMDAMDLYQARRQRYGDGWQRYGWLDSLFHMRNKMLRIEAEFWTTPPDNSHEATVRLDNAMDLLNYIAFFIRNVYDENERGR